MTDEDLNLQYEADLLNLNEVLEAGEDLLPAYSVIRGGRLCRVRRAALTLHEYQHVIGLLQKVGGDLLSVAQECRESKQ